VEDVNLRTGCEPPVARCGSQAIRRFGRLNASVIEPLARSITKHKASRFRSAIVAPERLRKPDAFRFFRELLNHNLAVVDAARLTHDTHLDYFVSGSSVDCHRDHLLVGDRIDKVLTTKEPPSQTFAFLLQDLYEITGEFIACLDWQRIASDRMRRDVQSQRRHFFNKCGSLVNYGAPEMRPEEMLGTRGITADST
jgi:hypothetical protein